MPSPLSEALLVGCKFGVYEVGECIGRGAMGHVYRAEHTLLKKRVALKIMTTAARNSSAGHTRFTREARAAAAIKHPNVVDIMDMGVLDGLPFIVMEFLEGEDLETYLKRHGTLSDRQLADLALPIIAAIGAVHDAGVVHRDIKPSNIFLAKGPEDDFVPKVLDFGISKAVQREGDSAFIVTGPEDLIGTPLYISPEGLRGSQNLTAKSDQYSLGVVLYECATGRRPHEGQDLGRLVHSILSDTVEPLRRLKPSVSVEMESAVLRAISRRAEDRYEHIRELGSALWPLASKRTRHVWAKRFSEVAETFVGPPQPPTAIVPGPDVLKARSIGAALFSLLLAGVVIASVSWFRTRSRGAAALATASTSSQLALTSAVPQHAVQPLSPVQPRSTVQSLSPVQPVAEASVFQRERAATPQESAPVAPRRSAPRVRAAGGKSSRDAAVRGAASIERRALPRHPEREADPTLHRAPPASNSPHSESLPESRGANESPLLD